METWIIVLVTGIFYWPFGCFVMKTKVLGLAKINDRITIKFGYDFLWDDKKNVSNGTRKFFAFVWPLSIIINVVVLLGYTLFVIPYKWMLPKDAE